MILFVGHFGLMLPQLNTPILFLSLGQFHGRIYEVSYKTNKRVMSLEFLAFPHRYIYIYAFYMCKYISSLLYICIPLCYVHICVIEQVQSLFVPREDDVLG